LEFNDWSGEEEYYFDMFSMQKQKSLRRRKKESVLLFCGLLSSKNADDSCPLKCDEDNLKIVEIEIVFLIII
jgi:hypothetical protein